MRILNISVNEKSLPTKEQLIEAIKSDSRNKNVNLSEINKAIKESGLYKVSAKSEARDTEDFADAGNDDNI